MERRTMLQLTAITTAMALTHTVGRDGLAVSPEIKWPADANFLDVTSYGADPTGAVDSTAAIQQAIMDALASMKPDNTRFRARCVYLPAGTYLVSDTVGGGGPGLRLCGAGVDRTIIKLADNSPGYGSGAKNVLQCGYDVLANAAYGNHIEHLTIEIGAGNPAAVALEPNMANSGQMGPLRLVGIQSGKYGLRHFTTAGSGYLHDIEIEGFDVAIAGNGSAANNFVFEDISIANPRVAALSPNRKNWTFFDLTVSGAPAVVQSDVPAAGLCIVNGAFTGGMGGPAIDFAGESFVYLRKITCDGYDAIVQINGVRHFVHRNSATEWSTVPYAKHGEKREWSENLSHPVSMNLRVKKFPQFHPRRLSDWAKVRAGIGDQTAAIQAAIDSGAKAVYLPWQVGPIVIDGTVVLRNRCRLLDFMYNQILGTGSIEVVDGHKNRSVSIENVVNGGPPLAIIKATKRPVSIRNHKLSRVSTTKGGDLFLTNVGPHAGAVISNGAKAWVRQWNRSVNRHMTVDDAKVWMLGLDYESVADKPMKSVEVLNDGRLESIGGAADCKGIVHGSDEDPFWHVDDGKLSCVITGYAHGQGTYHRLIDDGEHEITDAELTEYQINARGRRIAFPPYVSS